VVAGPSSYIARRPWHRVSPNCSPHARICRSARWRRRSASAPATSHASSVPESVRRPRLLKVRVVNRGQHPAELSRIHWNLRAPTALHRPTGREQAEAWRAEELALTGQEATVIRPLALHLLLRIARSDQPAFPVARWHRPSEGAWGSGQLATAAISVAPWRLGAARRRACARALRPEGDGRPCTVPSRR